MHLPGGDRERKWENTLPGDSHSTIPPHSHSVSIKFLKLKTSRKERVEVGKRVGGTKGN